MPGRDCKARVFPRRFNPCRNKDDIHNTPNTFRATSLSTAQLLLYHVFALPRHPRRHPSTDRTVRGRTDLGTSTRSRPERHSIGHVQDPLMWSVEPLMGTRTISTTPPASHLGHWSGIPSQHRESDRLYRQMRIRAAYRESGRTWGELLLAPGHNLVPRTIWVKRVASAPRPSPREHTSGIKLSTVSGGWAK